MIKALQHGGIAFALAIFLNGCGRDDVKVYRVEKEDAPASVAPVVATGAPTPVQNQNPLPQLKFTLPPKWTKVAPGQMRAASFIITNSAGETVDVGVIPLPMEGQEIPLMNMWRQQMQLPALTNESAAGTGVLIGDAPGKLFEIASEALLIEGKFRARIFVAELSRGGMSWFFKMTGEESFVASQRESFLQFLKSVSFVDQDAAGILTAKENSSSASAGKMPAAPSMWKVPSTWQPMDAGAMLLAKFSTGDGAEVNVSSLAGAGGGLLANVNRWRGQLGLPPLTEENFSTSVSAFDDSGGPARLVDFSGTNARTGKPARLVAVVMPQGDRTWFYKLMGDDAAVVANKDAFIKFIQSANYANAR